jgi:hypothetical protein
MKRCITILAALLLPALAWGQGNWGPAIRILDLRDELIPETGQYHDITISNGWVYVDGTQAVDGVTDRAFIDDTIMGSYVAGHILYLGTNQPAASSGTFTGVVAGAYVTGTGLPASPLAVTGLQATVAGTIVTQVTVGAHATIGGTPAAPSVAVTWPTAGDIGAITAEMLWIAASNQVAYSNNPHVYLSITNITLAASTNPAPVQIAPGSWLLPTNIPGATGPQGPAGSNGVAGATGATGPAGTNGTVDNSYFTQTAAQSIPNKSWTLLNVTNSTGGYSSITDFMTFSATGWANCVLMTRISTTFTTTESWNSLWFNGTAGFITGTANSMANTAALEGNSLPVLLCWRWYVDNATNTYNVRVYQNSGGSLDTVPSGCNGYMWRERNAAGN